MKMLTWLQYYENPKNQPVDNEQSHPHSESQYQAQQVEDQFQVAAIDFQVLLVEGEVDIGNVDLMMVVLGGIILHIIQNTADIQIINHLHTRIIREDTVLVPGVFLVGASDPMKNILETQDMPMSILMEAVFNHHSIIREAIQIEATTQIIREGILVMVITTDVLTSSWSTHRAAIAQESMIEDTEKEDNISKYVITSYQKLE